MLALYEIINPILIFNLMKTTQIAVIAVIGLVALSLYNLSSNMEPRNETMFNTWMNLHGKTYELGEKSYRYGIWLENFKFVQEHNARYEAGLETYNLEMNLFADLSNEEFGKKYLMKPDFVGAPSITTKCTGKALPVGPPPPEIDWSAKGAVTPIKNQGQCGSCWAFSATGSLEGAYFQANQKLISFSEQELVDCSKKYGNNGCNGGLMDYAFGYVVDNGITFESVYNYTAKQGACK